MTNPYGNDSLVDQVIGSAYQVVRYVAANMEVLIDLSEAMDTVQSVLTELQELIDSLPALLPLSDNLPQLLEIHSHLTELLAIYGNLGMLTDIYDHLSIIQVIYDNLETLADNQALLNISFEALRRSYAEAGYNVMGTFQAGFTIVNANDVGIDLVTGKGFTGPTGTVAAGTDPASGGFVDRSGYLNIDPYSVEHFGASANKTIAENRAALQAAIASADGKGLKISVPPYINYGFNRTDKATWPDFSGLSASPFTRIFIEDYSQGNGTTLPAREGAQLRKWFFTGSQTDGQHNGNFEYMKSGWHPGYFISHDGDLAEMAAGAGVNRRASVFFATNGVANWKVGQGRITNNTATEAELTQFVISANGHPDLGTTGLTTNFVINKTNGAVGFNVGSPRYPFDFVSRAGQPSVGTFGFETPTGEATLRLAGETNDLRINAKANSGFSVNDATSALFAVTAGGAFHNHYRNTAGNVSLSLKTLTKERRMMVRDDNGTLNFQSTSSANILVLSDTDLTYSVTPIPNVDATTNIGSAAKRWNVVYASTGAINTSDGREKSVPKRIDDDVLDAWGDVQLICFQWLSMIQQKSEDVARWHFGVIAQQVRDAFLSRGIDGTKYGLLCYDEWEDKYEKDEDGNDVLVQKAGSRWGIRPDQCLFLEAAYQRRRCERIEARLSAAGL